MILNKIFAKLMNNAVFGKTENHRNNRLYDKRTKEELYNLKPNYHPKFFSKNFISYTNEIKNQEYYRSTSLFRSVNIRNQ